VQAVESSSLLQDSCVCTGTWRIHPCTFDCFPCSASSHPKLKTGPTREITATGIGTTCINQ
jgi:hypothetical protein